MSQADVCPVQLNACCSLNSAEQPHAMLHQCYGLPCSFCEAQSRLLLLLQRYGGVHQLPLPFRERVDPPDAPDQAGWERPGVSHDRGVQSEHR